MRVEISSFGATPGADCTQAIQKAIDACADDGGGEVVIPPGRYVTGTLFLKSGVTLHLCERAVLVGSAHILAYTPDVHRSMYAAEAGQDRCLIFARDARDIAITGRGSIDGQGSCFPDPADGQRQRPMLIRFVECRRVLLRDVRLVNAASTGAAILYSQDLCIDRVRINNREAEDGDGLTLDGCRGVRVAGCDIDAGRDAICIHCSRSDRPAVNAIISDCMLSGRSSAIRVGLLSVGMIQEVAMSNCILRDIEDTAVKVQVNEGGVAQNVRFSNLVIREAGRAAFISLSRYRAGVTMPAGLPPMGSIRGITLHGIQMHTCRSADRRAAIIVVGSRDGKIEDVWISDADLLVGGGGVKYEGRITDVRELGAGRPEPKALGNSLPAYGLYARHVAGLHVANVRYRLDLPDARDAQALDDVSES